MNQEFPNPLVEVNVWSKIQSLERSANAILMHPRAFSVPKTPGRDVLVLDIKKHPPKPGLSHKEGRARLLHDLASIELQALELGCRTLFEFPEAPTEFRERLLEVTLEEGRHLTLCLQGLEKLGANFGDFPVHTVLWDCTEAEDSLLDRILIVHRYLEGSGLDASNLILRRLTGCPDPIVENAVRVIANEEVGHVLFGSVWFRKISESLKLDPNEQFVERLKALRYKLPRRLDAITEELRKKAGFNDVELEALRDVRTYFQTGQNRLFSSSSPA